MTSTGSRGFSIIAVLVIVALAIVLVLAALTYSRWEGQPPVVTFDRDFKAIGRMPELGLKVEDAGTGLKQITVRLKQNNQETILADEVFPRSAGEKSKTYDLGKLISEKHKSEEGVASLNVTVTDHALRHFLGGNRTEAARDFSFDTKAPTLEVLSTQHYINQGGSGRVVYRVSEDAVSSGVRVGPHFFPGFALKGSDASMRFALFAYAYNLPTDTLVQAVARDEAGNETIAGVWQKVFPKAFRSRDIALEDNFLQKVVPEILSRTPSVKDQGDLVKTFVELNNNLRKQNHETIAKLSRESPGEFLWKDAFLQLSNSQVESLFADHRTYVYKGNPVDKQDHVGFDLSVVKHYPIEAANDGKVILADYLGIYGNTVLIDHGAGLVSLYGHMSSIDVKTGEMVKKKQVLGKSGDTGLAGGDHLHFGLFLQGVPVNPTEWWDQKWIKDHVVD